MTIEQILAQRMKLLRAEQNITQEELAFRSGVSIDNIRQLEGGRKLARLDTIFKLCKGLNTHPDNFINAMWDSYQSEIVD